MKPIKVIFVAHAHTAKEARLLADMAYEVKKEHPDAMILVKVLA